MTAFFAIARAFHFLKLYFILPKVASLISARFQRKSGNGQKETLRDPRVIPVNVRFCHKRNLTLTYILPEWFVFGKPFR